MKNEIQEFIDGLGPEYEGYANSINIINREKEDLVEENKRLKAFINFINESISDTCNEGFVWVNVTPEMVKERIKGCLDK